MILIMSDESTINKVGGVNGFFLKSRAYKIRTCKLRQRIPTGI